MILEALLGAVGGGATGILGSAVTAVAGHFKQRSKNAHEIEMAKMGYRSEALKSKNDRDIALEEARTKRYEASMRDQSARMSTPDDPNFMKWPDAIKSYVRPVITLASLIYLPWMWYTTTDPEMKSYLTVAIAYASTTILMWWFGGREMKKLGA